MDCETRALLLRDPGVVAQYRSLIDSSGIDVAERYLTVVATLDSSPVTQGPKAGPNYNRRRIGMRVVEPRVSPRG